MSTTDIRLRVSEDIKIEAEEIFKQMGMTMLEAMRIFLKQCINTGSLPFKPHVKIPNKETLESFKQVEKGEFETYNLDQFEEFLDKIPNKKTVKTFKDTDKRIGLTTSNNTKEMFNKLGV